MRVKEIILENFRQFYGIQKLAFSESENANVTVVHGENGSGKTALLNAFKWAFYGETDFESGSNDLICERMLVESSENDELKLSVCVKFSHENKNYEAKRTEYYKKLEGLNYRIIGESSFELSWIDGSGAYEKSTNSSTHINQILPKRMHPYFFFNGERIEKLSKIESSSEIQRAIKGMMGIEIIERLGRHLSDHVIKNFKGQLKKLSTSDLKDAIEKEAFYTERVEEAHEKIQQLSSEKRQYRSLLNDQNEQLKQISAISEMQKERENLENDIVNLNESINSLSKEKLQYVSRYGFLAVSLGMITKAKEILDEKRKKGELPSKIKEQFLNDLLVTGECICGRPLVKDSEPFGCIESFKKTAVTSDVENAFITTSSAVVSMKGMRETFFQNLHNFRKRIKEFENHKKAKHGRIDEISSKIGKNEVEDIARLEDKREEYREKLSSIDQLLGEWNVKLTESNGKLDKWSKVRKDLDKNDKASVLVNTRLELAEEMKRVVDELHYSLSEAVRKELSTIVNDTFRAIIKKEYWAEIDEEYTLQIKKKIGDHIQNVVGKSTGESQISSLSFIGGLVSLAKKRHGQGSEYYKGGLYPIVMDSPYGMLDPEYREKVASYLPDLAEQVIIMVSNSQWKNEVEVAVKGRVGREYTLLYHTPHKKEDTKTSSVIEGEKYEFTQIKEGYYE